MNSDKQLEAATSQENDAEIQSKKEKAAQAFLELIARKRRQREYWLNRKAERHGLVYVPKGK